MGLLRQMPLIPAEKRDYTDPISRVESPMSTLRLSEPAFDFRKLPEREFTVLSP